MSDDQSRSTDDQGTSSTSEPKPVYATLSGLDDTGRANAIATEEYHRSRHERMAMIFFGAAMVGGVFSMIAYIRGADITPLGLGLAVALGGVGLGLVSWAKSFETNEETVQQREDLRIQPEDQEVLEHREKVTEETLGRRPVIGWMLVGSLGAIAAAMLGPLGSIGPRPKGALKHTAWGAGKRVVGTDGNPIKAEAGKFDELVTAFPEGSVGRDDSQIVALRVQPDLYTERTNQNGAVDGWVAYSKICTHAGCSVGLFGVDPREPHPQRQLVCPCHQSIFDPLDAARPIGGPAARSLPQLPLAVDGEGYLIATADFPRPVGPITWTEG